MRRLRFALYTTVVALMAVGLALPPLALAAPEDPVPLTFIATSDSHYVSSKNLDRIERNKVSIERMNAITGTPWPEKFGGGKVGKPRGVLALADLKKALPQCRIEWDGGVIEPTALANPDRAAAEWVLSFGPFKLTGVDILNEYKLTTHRPRTPSQPPRSHRSAYEADKT